MTTPTLARPEIRRRRMRLSPFWAFPVIALIVGAWLAYVTLSEQGPKITVEFKAATGLRGDSAAETGPRMSGGSVLE